MRNLAIIQKNTTYLSPLLLGKKITVGKHLQVIDSFLKACLQRDYQTLPPTHIFKAVRNFTSVPQQKPPVLPAFAYAIA